MSGAKHKEILSRIGLAGAIVPTYLEKTPCPQDNIKKLLNIVEFHVVKGIRFFGKAGKGNVLDIGAKIDLMREKTCLGKARSILTFIDFAVELMEMSMAGPNPLARIRGTEGIYHIKAIAQALSELRSELSGKNNHDICCRAGIRAAEIWKGAEI